MTTDTLTEDTLYCLHAGLVSLSVCAPADWQKARIEEQANAKSPTGISSCWEVTDEPKFATGQDNGCTCEQDEHRRHWLLHC